MKLYLALCLVTITLHLKTEYRNTKGKMVPYTGTCSGVFVSPNRVLTAGHCAKDVKKAWIENNLGLSLTSKFIKVDEVQDLALIQIDGISRDFAIIGEEPKITDRIYTVNSSNEMPNTYGEGVVMNIIRFDTDDASPRIISSLFVKPGASGGGLFNEKGQLIGIITSTTSMGSIAVNTPEIKRFLKYVK